MSTNAIATSRWTELARHDADSKERSARIDAKVNVVLAINIGVVIAYLAEKL